MSRLILSSDKSKEPILQCRGAYQLLADSNQLERDQEMNQAKKEVSCDTMRKRLNRQLLKEGQIVKWSREMGWYAVELATNSVTAQHIHLEEWCREMGVMKAGEVVRTE